jgi:sirohydrochlorin cobaltochelatase
MRNVNEALRGWLEAGGHEVGEIHLEAAPSGWELRHRADAGRGDLTAFSGADAARDLAHYDDAGNFRPLKTAPNLRHGWRLTVTDLADLRRTLDYFYPAMLGVWFSQTRGALHGVPLRTTLDRQTGMYRVTQKITDAQAVAMIADFCAGCLKQRLWTIDGTAPIELKDAAASLPLLCHEACNLLIAKAREVVKKAEQPS